MGRVLLLGRIQGDGNVLLVLGHVEDLPEGLETLCNHLDADLSLGDFGDLGDALLVGPYLIGGANGLPAV